MEFPFPHKSWAKEEWDQITARGGAELEMYLPPRDFTRDFRSVEEQLAYKSDISHSHREAG